VWLSLSVLVLATTAAGTLARTAAPPPEVAVVVPRTAEVSDYESFTGHTDAAATVHLRPRVSGYINQVAFKEGADVKKGDLLVEIDPRPYKAVLVKAEADLAVAKAQLKKAEAEHKRVKALFERKAIGKDEMDKAIAEREEAQGRVRACKASRDVASLNVDFTRIVAPISGRIGRRLVDSGNLVAADKTTLATLISTKPMYVYFNIDERTFLGSRRAGLGKGLQVALGLADEKDYPHRAEVDFVAGRVDPKTGTLRMRVTMPNADGLLVPGLFVRVRLTTSKPYKALLVPERAVERNLNKIGRTSWQGAAFVLVVNQKSEVEIREVRLGQQHGGLVVVKEGLKEADRVVLAGPQGLRPGKIVRAKKVAFPAGEK
jgi:RND family efflux transporter MFP subunit